MCHREIELGDSLFSVSRSSFYCSFVSQGGRFSFYFRQEIQQLVLMILKYLKRNITAGQSDSDLSATITAHAPPSTPLALNFVE